MDKKITRRAVLGTIIAGMVAMPFITREWHRRRKITLPPDSFLAGLRTRFQPILDFPRKFDIKHDDGISWIPLSGSPDGNAHRKALARFNVLPKDVQETIIETHRRYWQNFAQIDEIEFDCTNFRYNPDGTRKTIHGNFEGHVRLKYGHGLEIVGKNAKGESIHGVFNLEGDISPEASEFNLSSMMHDFFGAYRALPAETLLFDYIYSTMAELPENPYIKTVEGDKYTILSQDRYLQSIEFPPHIEGKIFYGCYYNNRTGMLDYYHSRTFNRSVVKLRPGSEGKWVIGEGVPYLHSDYVYPSDPLPQHVWTTEYWKNIEVESGLFLPVEHATYGDGDHKNEWLVHKATYSNIRVKRV